MVILALKKLLTRKASRATLSFFICKFQFMSGVGVIRRKLNKPAGVNPVLSPRQPTYQRKVNIMTQLSIPTQEPDISIINGKAATTSLDVAKFFDKEHAKVVRSIQTLLKQEPKWGVANFGETHYINNQNGQEYVYFTMTRDGFVMLVMAYTGEKARKIKIRYINKFNEMESQLYGKPQLDTPSTKEDRKPLNALVNVLVSIAPFGYRDAWQMVKAHIGADKAEDITLSQLAPAMAFVQEKIDLYSVKPLQGVELDEYQRDLLESFAGLSAFAKSAAIILFAEAANRK